MNPMVSWEHNINKRQKAILHTGFLKISSSVNRSSKPLAYLKTVVYLININGQYIVLLINNIFLPTDWSYI